MKKMAIVAFAAIMASVFLGGMLFSVMLNQTAPQNGGNGQSGGDHSGVYPTSGPSDTSNSGYNSAFPWRIFPQDPNSENAVTDGDDDDSPVLGAPIYGGNNLEVFVKIDGITGESTDPNHLNWIEAKYYNYTCAGTRGANSFFAFAAPSSSATPHLFRATMDGRTIRNAIIAIQSTDGNGTKRDILTWKFEEVVLTMGSSTFSDTDGTLLDTCIIRCGKVEVEYKQLDANGNVVNYVSTAWIYNNIPG